MRDSEITSAGTHQEFKRAVQIELNCRRLGICASEYLLAENDLDRVPDFIKNTPSAKASTTLVELDRPRQG